MSDHFDESDQNGHPPEPDAPLGWPSISYMGAGHMWPHVSNQQRDKLVHEMRLLRLRHIPRGMWWTRDERQMFISEMNDGHLNNTIAMLERMKVTRSRKYHELVAERSMRRLRATQRLAKLMAKPERKDVRKAAKKR